MAKETSTLKRAYCPKCSAENELDRIFMVNPDADVCYCPVCMREQKPKDAIDNYNYFLANKISKADRMLYSETRFYEAYCAYARVIEIDATSIRSRFGRILSLIYMSTLRKTNFHSARLLLESEAEQYFRRLKEQIHYVKFLNKINTALDEYRKRYIKRLSWKERFYNIACVEIYFIRLNEIIELKTFLLEEMRKSFVKADDGRIRLAIEELDKNINEYNKAINDRVVTMDGFRYKLSSISKNNVVALTKLKDDLAPFYHAPKRKLDENEKGGRLIKDKVFPDNTGITLFINASIPISVFFLVLAAGLFGSIFFMPEEFKISLYIASGVSLIIGIVFITLYGIWRGVLNKRRHLID